MPTVANLAVSVTARTSKFNKKMQRAAKNVRAFGREVVDVGKRLVTFGSLAGGVAAAGLTVAVRQSFKLIDAQAKLADTLGLTIGELVGFQHAAKLAGSNAEGMDKALTQFVRRLGEASTRTGEMRDAVQMLGLDEAALVAMGTAKAFRTVADRIALLPNAAERAEAAYRLFGRQGVALVKALTQGSTWFEKITKRTREFGLVLTRLEAQVVENANDALTDLAAVMVGTANQIARHLAPFVHWAAEELVQFATAGGGAGMKVTRAFALIAEAGATLAQGLAFLQSAWHGLNSVVLDVSSSILRSFDVVLQGLRMFLAEVVKGIRALGPLLPAGFLPIEWQDLLKAAREYEDIAARTQKKVAELAGILAADALEATKKMGEAWQSFTTGKAGEDFKAMLRDIEERMRKIAEDILKVKDLGPKIPLLPLESLRGGAAARAARRAEFKQISLSRVAVQGINMAKREQLVRDPQLATTNELLNRIRFALSLPIFGLTK